MSWPSSPVASLCRALDRARRRTEARVIMGIDVEPDPRVFDRRKPPPWQGFERFVEVVPSLRQRLSEATGAPVAFTWFLRMDPQVAQTWGSPSWLAETYGGALAELVAAGDQLALHTHTWRTEAKTDTWVADYEDPSWVDHCLNMGLDAFEAGFGRPCEAYRGGDYFLDGAMLSTLGRRGIKVDMTVEPGRSPVRPPGGEPARGRLPDYRNVPTVPYRSSPAAFPAPDPRSPDGPLLIPLFSAPGKRGLRWPLSPETTSSRFVPRLTAELVREPPAVVAVTARSDAPLDSRWNSLVNNLEHLARHRQVRFITASAAGDGAS